MKKVLRETEHSGESTVMSLEDFENDLRFQIGEDYSIGEDYEEYIEEHGEEVSKEQYDNMRFDWFLKEMNDGYSIEIMGDRYTFI